MSEDYLDFEGIVDYLKQIANRNNLEFQHLGNKAFVIDSKAGLLIKVSLEKFEGLKNERKRGQRKKA